MLTRCLPRLAVICLLAANFIPARADEASDRRTVNAEMLAARRLATECWDLPRTLDAFTKVEQDYAALQEKYPQSRDKSAYGIMANIQDDIEVLTWQEWASTPDDPHGIGAVATRLQLHFQAAQADEAAKLWQEASEEYDMCARHWTAVKTLHPGWQPDFVAGQIQACMERLRVVEANQWKEKSPESQPSPRFSPQLSPRLGG